MCSGDEAGASEVCIARLGPALLYVTLMLLPRVLPGRVQMDCEVGATVSCQSGRAVS